MKTPGLIVQIPDPCHEDWNKMEPNDTGRFCGSCCKSVVDFTGKTDVEIRDILIRDKDNKVCGRFRKTQLNRPLNLKINLNDLPPNMSVTKLFALSVLLVFGSLLFSCKDQIGKDVVLGEIEPFFQKDAYTLTTYTASSPVHTSGAGSGESSCGTEQISSNIPEEEYMTGEPAYTEEELVLKGKPSFQPDPVDTLGKTQVVDTVFSGGLPGTFSDDYMGGAVIVTELSEEVIADNKQTTGVEETSANHEPALFELFPNPGNSEFILKYDVLRRNSVRVDIFDAAGNHVKTLVNINHQHEGKYQIPFRMDGLAAGVYVVSFITEGKRITKKLVVEK